MWAVLPYLLPLGIVIIANLGVKRRRWRLLTYISLGLLNAVMLFMGLLFLSVPYLLRLSGRALSPDLQSVNISGLGLAFAVTAILSFACLPAPSRRMLARCLPIDPGSPVHTTALILLVYLAITSASLLISSQDLISASIEIASVEPGTVVLGQAVLLLFALAGVGLGTRRNVRQTLARLNLRALTLRHVAVATVMVGAFLAMDYATALIWHQLWPASYESVMGSSQQLFARFASPLGALVLALSAGIGEETLFRGALQPRFRVPLTAAVFALSHVQYALSPAIVEIFIVGLVLGWLRERTNTTTCMAVHAGYNFLDMLLMPYFP